MLELGLLWNFLDDDGLSHLLCHGPAEDPAIDKLPVSRRYTPLYVRGDARATECSGNFSKGFITGGTLSWLRATTPKSLSRIQCTAFWTAHRAETPLATSNHYSAIDIEASISRLMADIVSQMHKQQDSRLRDIEYLREKRRPDCHEGSDKLDRLW